MATNRASAANGTHTGSEKSYYEQQRELLVTEIAQSLEIVLQNINKLNRSLEEVTQVGNEFAPVESLWSHFENVMAKDPNEQQGDAQEGATEHEGEETEVTEHQK
ncbi:DASH complex subunit Dad1-domain-containing protein [Pyrenochaeta sp. MPI-SDFR-AT-0127]|nr:DASH complex subunit Dad1-domain-containing protein [Pyrenochaeta sp. MPI-SDFR-AT-0127]